MHQDVEQARYILSRWIEWARMHGHLEHAGGIVIDSKEYIEQTTVHEPDCAIALNARHDCSCSRTKKTSSRKKEKIEVEGKEYNVLSKIVCQGYLGKVVETPDGNRMVINRGNGWTWLSVRERIQGEQKEINHG